MGAQIENKSIKNEVQLFSGTLLGQHFLQFLKILRLIWEPFGTSWGAFGLRFRGKLGYLMHSGLPGGRGGFGRHVGSILGAFGKVF